MSRLFTFQVVSSMACTVPKDVAAETIHVLVDELRKVVPQERPHDEEQKDVRNQRKQTEAGPLQ